MTDFNFKSFAHLLADEAGIISRQYFGNKLDIITKGDDSPVTSCRRGGKYLSGYIDVTLNFIFYAKLRRIEDSL
jgi:hypothetical protein